VSVSPGNTTPAIRALKEPTVATFFRRPFGQWYFRRRWPARHRWHRRPDIEPDPRLSALTPPRSAVMSTLGAPHAEGEPWHGFDA
jgi:hypothetical protein